MNYIQEINAFYDWLETNPISDTAIALWHTLMHVNNKAGWITEFAVAISTLEAKSGMKKDAVLRARNRLQQVGRITFQSRNGQQSAIYTIIPFDCVVLTGANRAQTERKPSAKRNTNRAQTASINKLNETETKDNIPFREIVDFLNQAAGTNYKHSGKRTRDHITARWNDGNRLPDFEMVITKKVAEWNGTEYAKYLRPETLFGPKFEGYLNQPDHKTNVVKLSSKGGRKGNEYYDSWGE